MKYFQGPGSRRWWAFNNSGGLHSLTIRNTKRCRNIFYCSHDPIEVHGDKGCVGTEPGFNLSLERSRNDFHTKRTGGMGRKALCHTLPSLNNPPTVPRLPPSQRKVPHDLVLDKCSLMRGSSEVLFRCVPYVEPASVHHLPLY